MATKIYLGQLMHFSAVNAVESHETDVSGVVRVGARAPDLEDLIGEIADSPTANTLMGRLKTIAGSVGAGATQATTEKILAAMPTMTATETALATILAKLITAPATEAKQDSTITNLGAILAKLADPATQAGLTAILTQLQSGLGVTVNGSKGSFTLSSTATPISVAVGGNTSIAITPAVGEMWVFDMIAFVVNLNTSATTGTHKVGVYQGINGNSCLVYEVSAAYNAMVRNNAISDPACTKLPLRGLRISNNVPLYFKYTNNTDAAQTVNFELITIKEVIPIV